MELQIVNVEVCDPGVPLGVGQIRDSNRFSIISLLKSEGFQATDMGIIRDRFVNDVYNIINIDNHVRLNLLNITVLANYLLQNIIILP